MSHSSNHVSLFVVILKLRVINYGQDSYNLYLFSYSDFFCAEVWCEFVQGTVVLLADFFRPPESVYMVQ